MSAYRVIFILLALAIAGVATIKIVNLRQSQTVEQTDAAQSERIRQFWSDYKQAGEKRAAGDLLSAVALYRSALQRKPDHEDSLYYSGNCYFELGRYQEAITAYERLIAVNPLASSRGYMQLGLVYASLEPGAPFDLKKAAGLFEQALQLDPDSGALLGIGEVALLEGRFAAARAALEKDNADNHMSMATAYLLGYLCWRERQPADAWRWFHLAVERGELKKPAVKWTEEGDVKADPELRWRALARQSVFGKYWLRLRAYLKTPDFPPTSMESEYQSLSSAIAAIGATAQKQAAHR